MLASCSTELKVNNSITGACESSYRSLYSPDETVMKLSWSSDDSHVILLPKNGFAEILDARNGTKFKTRIPVSQTSAVTFQNTRNNLAIGTIRGQLVLYNADSGQVIPSDHEVLMPIKFLEFNSVDTQMAAGGGKQGRIVLLSKFKLSSCLLMPKGTGLTAMRFHREFNQLAAGGENGIVNIWDTQEGSTIFCNSVHTSDVTDVTFVPDMSMAISVSKDCSCVIHDLRNDRTTIFSFCMPTPLASVDASPSKDYNFVLSTDMGEIYMYDLRKMCCPIFQRQEHNSRINMIRFQSQPVASMGNDELTVDDGGKAPKSHKSVVELYKAGLQFLQPDESLSGMCGKSGVAFSESETGGLKEARKQECSGNLVEPNYHCCGGGSIVCDANRFKKELLEEVRGMMTDLQDDMKMCVTDLRNFCSKEFGVLGDLIDTRCRASETFRKVGGGESQKAKETPWQLCWGGAPKKTAHRDDCTSPFKSTPREYNEKLYAENLFKHKSN